MSMMRASVESPRSRVTRTSSAPRPLIVPANTSSPIALLGGQRLARDRRLVDVALAGGDPAVERNLLAGPDDDDVADGDAVHRHAAERAGRGVPHERLGGRQIHQRADGAARALHRARLEQLRQREQEDDGRPFAPLAEHHRAGDGDEHEDVDVERQRARRVQRAAHAVDAAAGDRRRHRPR